MQRGEAPGPGRASDRRTLGSRSELGMSEPLLSVGWMPLAGRIDIKMVTEFRATLPEPASTSPSANALERRQLGSGTHSPHGSVATPRSFFPPSLPTSPGRTTLALPTPDPSISSLTLNRVLASIPELFVIGKGTDRKSFYNTGRPIPIEEKTKLAGRTA